MPSRTFNTPISNLPADSALKTNSRCSIKTLNAIESEKKTKLLDHYAHLVRLNISIVQSTFKIPPSDKSPQPKETRWVDWAPAGLWQALLELKLAYKHLYEYLTDAQYSSFNMAEEAMAFIAAKYFNFDDDGNYIPYDPGVAHDPTPTSTTTMASTSRSPQTLGTTTRPHNAFNPNLAATYHQSPAQYQGPARYPAAAAASSSAIPVVQDAATTLRRPTHPPTASVSSGGGASAGQVTVGLRLVMNNKTYPKIEGGRERWYTQRPGHSNSYSRYSDLVSHDKAKGLTPMPKASKADLQAARLQQTFGWRTSCFLEQTYLDKGLCEWDGMMISPRHTPDWISSARIEGGVGVSFFVLFYDGTSCQMHSVPRAILQSVFHHNSHRNDNSSQMSRFREIVPLLGMW
jgi:hypothetical protein